MDTGTENQRERGHQGPVPRPVSPLLCHISAARREFGDTGDVAYLRHHLAVLATEREAFGNGYHDSGLLVCHPDGRPVHPDTITERFNRLVDRAGVKRIRLHDVRHTYATTPPSMSASPNTSWRSCDSTGGGQGTRLTE